VHLFFFLLFLPTLPYHLCRGSGARTACRCAFAAVRDGPDIRPRKVICRRRGPAAAFPPPFFFFSPLHQLRREDPVVRQRACLRDWRVVSAAAFLFFPSLLPPFSSATLGHGRDRHRTEQEKHFAFRLDARSGMVGCRPPFPYLFFPPCGRRSMEETRPLWDPPYSPRRSRRPAPIFPLTLFSPLPPLFSPHRWSAQGETATG